MKEKLLLITGIISGGLSWCFVKTAWLYFIGEMSLIFSPERVDLEKWTAVLIAMLIGVALIFATITFYCLKRTWHAITK